MKYLLAALLLVAPLAAQASCGRINYKISGLVTSATGDPVRNAYVLFSWVELSNFVQQGEMRTNQSGAYSITIYFNPIVGYDPDRGHTCNRTLESVIVSVYANGHQPKTVRRALTGTSTRASFILPTL